MLHGSIRDEYLARVMVYSKVRRVEIAKAEDAVKKARAALQEDGQPTRLDVTSVLQEELIRRLDTLVETLQR